MVKAKKHKKKRRKVSDAWKNLKKLHRKGPKRVKLDNPRKKKRRGSTNSAQKHQDYTDYCQR